MKPIYISAYTKGTRYEAEVKYLVSSLEKLGLEYHLFPYNDTGSWELNCQKKANLIKAALCSFKRPVVWIDADAIVVKKPDLFDILSADVDIAYHWLENPDHLASGTLYFGYTQNAINICQKWIALNKKHPGELDQRTLQKVLWNDRIFSPNKGYNQVSLPVEYCKIYDNVWQNEKIKEEPVIMHYQASRLEKRSKRMSTKVTGYQGKWVLICGNGPSLDMHFEKHGLNYGDYDYILRMNNWKPSPKTGDKCDIWHTTFWYDIEQEQIKAMRDKLVWDCFMTGVCYEFDPNYRRSIQNLMGRDPDYSLTQHDFDHFRKEVIKTQSPSAGMYAIYMALQKEMFITLAGFDFFQGEKHHYYEDKKLDLSRMTTPHQRDVEREWCLKLEADRKIRILR